MGGPQKLNAQVVPIYWEGGRFATRSNGLVRLGRRSAQSEAVRAALPAGATRRPVAHGRALRRCANCAPTIVWMDLSDGRKPSIYS